MDKEIWKGMHEVRRSKWFEVEQATKEVVVHFEKLKVIRKCQEWKKSQGGAGK